MGMSKSLFMIVAVVRSEVGVELARPHLPKKAPLSFFIFIRSYSNFVVFPMLFVSRFLGGN